MDAVAAEQAPAADAGFDGGEFNAAPDALHGGQAGPAAPIVGAAAAAAQGGAFDFAAATHAAALAGYIGAELRSYVVPFARGPGGSWTVAPVVFVRAFREALGAVQSVHRNVPATFWDERVVGWFTSAIEDGAVKTAMRNVVAQRQQGGQPTSLDVVTDVFVSRYAHAVRPEIEMRNLEDIEQVPGETAAEFANRLRARNLEMQVQATPEKLLGIFRLGLLDDHHVDHVSSAATLDEAANSLSDLEALKAQRQRRGILAASSASAAAPQAGGKLQQQQHQQQHVLMVDRQQQDRREFRERGRSRDRSGNRQRHRSWSDSSPPPRAYHRPAPSRSGSGCGYCGFRGHIEAECNFKERRVCSRCRLERTDHHPRDCPEPLRAWGSHAKRASPPPDYRKPPPPPPPPSAPSAAQPNGNQGFRRGADQ